LNYEGDERPLEEQRADPISSQGYQFEFPKGQFAPGDYFDVCVEISGGLSDCKTLTKSQSNQQEEVISYFEVLIPLEIADTPSILS
jgi:hypothetical protein